MAFLSQRLCDRVDQLGAGFDYTEHQQLNLDAALTLYRFGLGQEAQGYPCTARETFNRSVQLRNLVLPDDKWDAPKEVALGKLVLLDTRIGHVHAANYSTAAIDRMYTGLETRDEHELA